MGFVRWTEQRNFEAVLDMIADGRIDVTPLITHRLPFDRATDAYDLIKDRAPCLGVVLYYPVDSRSPEEVQGRSVRVTAPTSPITDLLALAKAKVLLASGASSFSTYGASLGQMPAILHPSQPLMETWRYRAEKGQTSVEFDPARSDEAFLQQAWSRLRE